LGSGLFGPLLSISLKQVVPDAMRPSRIEVETPVHDREPLSKLPKLGSKAA